MGRWTRDEHEKFLAGKYYNIIKKIFSPTNLWKRLAEGSGIHQDKIFRLDQKSCLKVLQPDKEKRWPGDHKRSQTEQRW